jgi:hypothetical protein
MAKYAFIFLLAGCASPSIVEEAQLAQIRHLRETCMNNITNAAMPSPLLRVSAIHQCNAWARSKVL